MTAERMTPIQYTGEIWDGPAVHPELWHLLQQKDLLLELSCGTGPFQVVLGVPHHAGPGIERIAEDWINPKTGQPGRPADETTGLAGLAVLTALREKGISARMVIAAHPTDHDPNKTPGCPYWERIFEQTSSGRPGLLLELHGAGRHRRHALELSAGRNTVADPLAYGKVLAFFLEGDWILAIQMQPGASDAQLYKNRQSTKGRLQNPALETLSLVHAGQLGIPALHLEMKAVFRQPDPDYLDSPRPAPASWPLARALAETLEITGRSDDIHISAAGLRTASVRGLPSSAFLTRPALAYEDSYLRAMRETDMSEWAGNPELRIWSRDGFVSLVEGTRQVIFHGLPEHPPEEYLWLIDQGEFIGRAFILHWLNEYRLKTDGQVDYWIRPSRRRQGYGRLILRLLLERFRQLGLEQILISCRSDNLASRKIIESNGGVFESEIPARDNIGYSEMRRRYWINL